MSKTAAQRLEIINQVRALRQEGKGQGLACRMARVDQATYLRWLGRFQEAGADGLADRPRTGRPRKAQPSGGLAALAPPLSPLPPVSPTAIPQSAE